MTQKTKITKQNRLEAVLRAEAEGVDLKDDGWRIHVCAKWDDGVLRTIGHVDKQVLHEDPEGFLKMVGRIKFGPEL